MNRASNTTMERTVLERQQWQQQRKQMYIQDSHFEFLPQKEEDFVGEFAYRSMKMDPDLENGLQGFPNECSDMNSNSISRTFSCPPVVGLGEKLVSSVARESFKKRKEAEPPKSVGAEEAKEKKIKGEVEEVGSKMKEQISNNHSRETSADIPKENSKISSQVQKTEYIHVRARRGQATDSHSLAERVRREKISERMRYLQDLVPGCNKIIGKAGMLDEIINYVQSLQRQVEFLSMKLATVNPMIDDHTIDNLFSKEMFQSSADSFPTVGMLSEVINPPFYPFTSVQQIVSCAGLDMEINPTELSLERTTSAPVSLQEEFLSSSCFSQTQPPVWENDLQSLYNIGLHQGRSTAFPTEPFQR